MCSRQCAQALGQCAQAAYLPASAAGAFSTQASAKWAYAHLAGSQVLLVALPTETLERVL